MAARRLCTVLVLAACERASTQPPAPIPPPPAPPPACTIRDGAIHAASQIVLHVHGRPFAWVSDADQLELHVQDDTASATATTAAATLSGEVDARSLQVRPRTPRPIDGWLEITNATAKGAKGSVLAVTVELPSTVHPLQPLALSIPCADVTVAEPPKIEPAGERIALRPGTTSPLALTPGGAPFANLAVPPEDPPEKMPPGLAELGGQDWIAHVLARQGGWAQIVLASWQARVTGWVPEHALVPAHPEPASALLGMLGTPPAVTLQRCPAAMPIFVRDGAAVIRVGTTRANAVLRITAKRDDEVELDLGNPGDGGIARAFGDQGPEPLHPFVRRADASGCAAAPAPSGDPASPS